jgi:hypothetical protein
MSRHFMARSSWLAKSRPRPVASRPGAGGRPGPAAGEQGRGGLGADATHAGDLVGRGTGLCSEVWPLGRSDLAPGVHCATDAEVSDPGSILGFAV